VFARGRPFQPCQRFVGEAKSLPWSGAFESFFTQVGTIFTRKHLTKLERFAKDKSSLLQTLKNYGCKKFDNIEP
jgi:hypothetical protein